MRPDPRYGFVCPGHKAIMGIPVVHTWRHSSGAILAIQRLGRCAGLLWRASDSWKSTVTLVAECDDEATFEENYQTAFHLGASLLEEGPPGDLLLSALKSAEVRQNRGRKGAKVRWDKHRAKQGEGLCYEATRAARSLEDGPNVDRDVWRWVSVDKAGDEWGLTLKNENDERDIWLYLDRVGPDKFKLTNDYSDKCLPDATVLESASLESCFSEIEAMCKRDPETWQVVPTGVGGQTR